MELGTITREANLVMSERECCHARFPDYDRELTGRTFLQTSPILPKNFPRDFLHACPVMMLWRSEP